MKRGKAMTVKEELKELKVAVNDITKNVNCNNVLTAKIEQHLKDMNGKLISVKKHVSETCPLIHEKLEEKRLADKQENDLMIKAINKDRYIIIGIAMVVFAIISAFLPRIVTKIWG